MHTSEEEDCDDLPPITVNSSAINSSAFVMPSADELAERRARDTERDRQLDELHLRAQRDQLVQELRHSDSSGSEGELALAAAAAALRVHDPPRAARDAPEAGALWAALAPHLPPPAAQLSPAQLPRAVDVLAAALAHCGAAWPDDELQCGAALLCVAAVARDSRARRPAARTLHALLDDCATPAQVTQLTAALLAALPEARVRLQLSDALRSGAGGGADRAAWALCEAALLAVLPGAAAAGLSLSLERVSRAAGAWRACDAEARGVCVALAGRLLAGAAREAGEGEARARLLAHLAPPPATASDTHLPDRLKALVGASKLQLLFSAKNSVSRQPRAQRVTSTSTNQKMEIENKS